MTEKPSFEQLKDWVLDGICEARCEENCIVEPDGHCPHGKPSWLLVMGYL